MKNPVVAVFGFAAVLIPLFIPLAALAGGQGGSVGENGEKKAEIYHTLEEKKEAGLMREITDRVSFSGLIEIEAFFESLSLVGEGKDASDVTLATAQLGFKGEISEHFTAQLILLFEEDGTEGVAVDEATVDFNRNGWSGSAGLQYLPTGLFPSHMISGPLTEELGEMRDTALRAGYGTDLFEITAFLGNGDVDEEGSDNHVGDWGVRVMVRPAEFIEAGASFFSDLGDSDAELVDALTGETGGWSVVAVARAGAFELLGELLGAVGEFNVADLDEDGNGEGDRPLAWNVEAAWEASEVLEIAARLEGSEELRGAPELQYGLCASWGAIENVSLSLEFLKGEFSRSFGEGIDSRTLVAMQLAVEF